MQIQSKIPDVGVTIFSVMTQLANEHGAINLSQGFPDFDPHPDLISLVHQHMCDGRNQYAPMPGVGALREALAAKVNDLYAASYHPENDITITAGATEAIFAAITTVVRPGDEVIVFEPAYDMYVPVIQLNGGRPVYVKLHHPDYRIDWQEVSDAISPQTRLIIINSPHNPSGMIFSSNDMHALADIVANSEAMVLSDEAYEHIVFDGASHESVSRFPQLAARSFVIGSFAKTYHSTGWKVGYCLAPDVLTRELRRIHQFVTFAVNTPIQYAFADFLNRKDLYTRLPGFYQQKRDHFLALINGSRFKPIPSQGTYYQLLDYSAISNEPDIEMAKRLTIDYGVASIPTSVFYHQNDDHHVLRFCFAKKEETLKCAAEKLCQI